MIGFLRQNYNLKKVPIENKRRFQYRYKYRSSLSVGLLP